MKMFLFGLLSFLIQAIAVANPDPIDVKSLFIKNSINLAKAKAAKEKKNIMVHFYADWCLPCKWIDENTFTDARVIKILKDNYVCLKVNIDDFDGFPVKQKYKIEYLPTVVFLDENGSEIIRYTEALPPSKLITALNTYGKQSQPVATTTESKSENEPFEMTKKKPILPEQKSKPTKPTVPATTAEAKNDIPPIYTKKVENVVPSSTIENTGSSVQDLDLEDIESAMVKSGDRFYRVQVGIFSDIQKVDELRNQLVNTYNKPFLIEMDAREGKKPRFIVFLGKFSSVTDAKACSNQLKKDMNIDTFAKEMTQY